MKTYEIVNPSDPYTICADDRAVAAVACFLLGQGQYAFTDIENGEDGVPIFLFGGVDAWTNETFGKNASDLIKGVLADKRDALIACLDSTLIGRPSDRASYEKGLELIDDPAKRKAWRDHWHDERRSSLNDIGGRAYELADRLRQPPPKVDQGVLVDAEAS